MSEPIFSQIDQLRALEGEPRVTYPYGDIDYPVTERLIKHVITKPLPAFLSLDPSPRFTTSKLVALQEVRTDRTLREYACRWERLPGLGMTSTRLGEDGNLVTITQTRKEASTIVPGETIVEAPPGTFTWTRISIQGGGGAVATEVKEMQALPGNLLSYSTYDAVTDSIVSETRQLVKGDTAAPDLTEENALTDYRDVPVSGLVKRRIIRRYPNDITSKTIIEYKRERFTYPALLMGWSFNKAVKAGHQVFAADPVIEAERPRSVPARLTTIFITDPTAVPTPLVIETARIQHSGFMFSLHTGPVLCDADEIIATATADDDWPGGAQDKFRLVATKPSRSQWITKRNAVPKEWFVYDYELRKIAHGLWMRTTMELPYW